MHGRSRRLDGASRAQRFDRTWQARASAQHGEADAHTQGHTKRHGTSTNTASRAASRAATFSASSRAFSAFSRAFTSRAASRFAATHPPRKWVSGWTCGNHPRHFIPYSARDDALRVLHPHVGLGDVRQGLPEGEVWRSLLRGSPRPRGPATADGELAEESRATICEGGAHRVAPIHTTGNLRRVAWRRAARPPRVRAR